MRWYDESLYLFRELQEVLGIVDMKTGELRRKADVTAEVETILTLLEDEIGSEKIQKGTRYIRKHQEVLLHYFDEGEAAVEELNAAIAERDVRHGLFRLYALPTAAVYRIRAAQTMSECAQGCSGAHTLRLVRRGRIPAVLSPCRADVVFDHSLVFDGRKYEFPTASLFRLGQRTDQSSSAEPDSILSQSQTL